MNTQTFLEEAAKLERLLYCVAWSMLSNSDDCADAVQETLMRAWQSRDTLRNLRSFRPWITRIMVNTCNTMLRKRLNQRWVPLEEDMAVLDAPTSAYVQRRIAGPPVPRAPGRGGASLRGGVQGA